MNTAAGGCATPRRVAQDYILCSAQVGNASGIPLGANGIPEGPALPFQGRSQGMGLCRGAPLW
jgi:hypothetical protein